MKILIVGRGGRESAILKKVLSSPIVSKVFCAPGNAQTAKISKNIDIQETSVDELLKFAIKERIDLTIVGPESSLEAGIVDLFESDNMQIFGPTKKATKIESSKYYSKKLMDKYGIPTARYREFTNSKEALSYAQTITYPHVIKYDGLAAGKGVVICENFDEMSEQIINMLDEKTFGKTSRIILEDFLKGEEFTLLSLVKGEKVYPLEISRDYKRAYDNDKGLNTGGMGAICPFDKINTDSKQQAIDILKQTASAMVKEENSFTGVLYGGFINTERGVKVIEFNARFGDPETEVVLQKLKSDLVVQILNVLNGKEVVIENDDKYYVGITVAAKGYPRGYEKNISLSAYDDEGIFHMGTKLKGDNILSCAGRVVFVSSSSGNLKRARQKAYEKVSKFNHEKLFYRLDIGE